jgi:hypothetical protein
MHVDACVLYAETAKAAQASLERKVAKLKDEQEAQSRALAEVSQPCCDTVMIPAL